MAQTNGKVMLEKVHVIIHVKNLVEQQEKKLKEYKKYIWLDMKYVLN